MRELWKLRPARKMTECVCLACGITFERWPSELKYGKGKHCSRACADRSRAGSGNPFHGRTHSDETKDAISKSRIGKASGARNHNWCGGVTLTTGRQFFTPAVRRKWIGLECVRCGATEKLELDHIVPVFAGGKTIRSNIQTLCGTCNKRKFQHEDRRKYQRR
jgi:hypothetical protein